MSAAKAKRLAIFVPHGNGYFVTVMRGIVDHAATVHDWDVRVECYMDIHLDDVRPGADIDGILAYIHRTDDPLAMKIRAANIPAINLLCDECDATLPQVRPDDDAVGRAAGRAFLERGFRRFAYFGFPNERFSERRRVGFVESVAAAGHTVAEHASARAWWNPTHDLDDLERMRRWLLDLPKPVGMLAATDSLARRVILLCRDLGLRVPEDIAVIGVDNEESVCEMISPAQSSIPLDGRRAGFVACTCLDELFAGRALAHHTTLIPPLPIVQRRSSDVFAVDDEDVNLAMRYIWENAHRPLEVADVLETVPTSRRSLERRFKKAMGRTLLDEIWRVHVEKAKGFLERTHWPMPRVAKESGFTSAKALSVVFTREVGMTPTGYRERYHR